jgi:hypothetical protein
LKFKTCQKVYKLVGGKGVKSKKKFPALHAGLFRKTHFPVRNVLFYISIKFINFLFSLLFVLGKEVKKLRKDNYKLSGNLWLHKFSGWLCGGGKERFFIFCFVLFVWFCVFNFKI